MSRNYKFHNPEGVYFVSSTVVEWIDVFTRNDVDLKFFTTRKDPCGSLGEKRELVLHIVNQFFRYPQLKDSTVDYLRMEKTSIDMIKCFSY